MANRFTRFQGQDYVDQYVPLPLDYINAGMANMQKTWDDTDAAIRDTAEKMIVQPGLSTNERAEKVNKKYKEALNQLTEEFLTSQNPAEVKRKLSSLRSQFGQDKDVIKVAEDFKIRDKAAELHSAREAEGSLGNIDQRYFNPHQKRFNEIPDDVNPLTWYNAEGNHDFVALHKDKYSMLVPEEYATIIDDYIKQGAKYDPNTGKFYYTTNGNEKKWIDDDILDQRMAGYAGSYLNVKSNSAASQWARRKYAHLDITEEEKYKLYAESGEYLKDLKDNYLSKFKQEKITKKTNLVEPSKDAKGGIKNKTDEKSENAVNQTIDRGYEGTGYIRPDLREKAEKDLKKEIERKADPATLKSELIDSALHEKIIDKSLPEDILDMIDVRMSPVIKDGAQEGYKIDLNLDNVPEEYRDIVNKAMDENQVMFSQYTMDYVNKQKQLESTQQLEYEARKHAGIPFNDTVKEKEAKEKFKSFDTEIEEIITGSNAKDFIPFLRRRQGFNSPLSSYDNTYFELFRANLFKAGVPLGSESEVGAIKFPDGYLNDPKNKEIVLKAKQEALDSYKSEPKIAKYISEQRRKFAQENGLENWDKYYEYYEKTGDTVLRKSVRSKFYDAEGVENSNFNKGVEDGINAMLASTEPKDIKTNKPLTREDKKILDDMRSGKYYAEFLGYVWDSSDKKVVVDYRLREGDSKGKIVTVNRGGKDMELQLEMTELDITNYLDPEMQDTLLLTGFANSLEQNNNLHGYIGMEMTNALPQYKNNSKYKIEPAKNYQNGLVLMQAVNTETGKVEAAQVTGQLRVKQEFTTNTAGLKEGQLRAMDSQGRWQVISSHKQLLDFYRNQLNETVNTGK